MYDEFELNNYKSMDELIKQGKKYYLSGHNITFKERDETDKIVIMYESLISRFYYAIEPSLINIELNEKEIDYYLMQPKLFCEEKYGTPELWQGLLYINNMTSKIYFTKRKIKAFSYNILDILQELILLNEKELRINKDRVESEI